MPRLLIERQFSDNLELDAAGAGAMGAINGEIGADWLYSFLSADRKKTYCLYGRADADLPPLLDGKSPRRFVLR